MEPCIYCSKEFDDSKGEGDHVIPRALGVFRYDVRFRRICPTCNNSIGCAEQQLLQCGPESLLRDLAGIVSRRGRGKSTSRGRGSKGVVRPEKTAEVGGYRLVVDSSSEDANSALPVDQLVVRDLSSKEKFVRLYPGMRVPQLKKRIADLDVKELTGALLSCDEARNEEFRTLIQKAFPNIVFQDKPATEAGVHELSGQVRFVLGEPYFRAIAKIGFHYYLTRSQRGVRGDEPEFAEVREFIFKGGEISKFFGGSGAEFRTPFRQLSGGGMLTSSEWCHILAADETNGKIRAYVQLFIGPECIGMPFHINLGTVSHKILIPSSVFCHAYFPANSSRSGSRVGRVERVSLTRLR